MICQANFLAKYHLTKFQNRAMRWFCKNCIFVHFWLIFTQPGFSLHTMVFLWLARQGNLVKYWTHVRYHCYVVFIDKCDKIPTYLCITCKQLFSNAAIYFSKIWKIMSLHIPPVVFQLDMSNVYRQNCLSNLLHNHTQGDSMSTKWTHETCWVWWVIWCLPKTNQPHDKLGANLWWANFASLLFKLSFVPLR